METSQKYKILNPSWQENIQQIIRKRMVGKSNVADITIEDSDLSNYEFKVTVMKYNSVKGWATIGYFRNDLFNGGIWRLTFKPRLAKGEKSDSGKTASYG